MIEIGNHDVLRILADATNVIAEGEVLPALRGWQQGHDEASYLKVIDAKTAMLFEASSHAGAVLAGAEGAAAKGLKAYGHHLGMAYQLIDDYLDYAGNAEDMGKNVGDDLAEGKVTLPLIHTIRSGTDEDAELVRNAHRRTPHWLHRCHRRRGAAQWRPRVHACSGGPGDPTRCRSAGGSARIRLPQAPSRTLLSWPVAATDSRRHPSPCRPGMRIIASPRDEPNPSIVAGTAQASLAWRISECSSVW